MSSKSDKLFARPLAEISGFRFDAEVVSVFPDMIKRSVPGYETIIAMTGTLAERYAQADSTCYDLGCSLCASTIAMRRHIREPGCAIAAVDNSEAMIERCRQVLAQDSGDTPVELICDDINHINFSNASMAVLNFTLQFIPLERRTALLANIAKGLKPEGILVLSEKVAFDDPQHQALMIELHHNFKRANGYSDLEISQKRTALEDVLIPETLDTHRRRLKKVGFTSVDVWFQCFNFASIIAFKD